MDMTKYSERAQENTILSEGVWLNNLMGLTVSSIQWDKLPKTIDPIYLERALYFSPSVVGFIVEEGPVVLKGYGSSRNNLYDIPTKRFVTANNGFTAELDNQNSFILWNDTTRTSGWYRARYYAKRLAKIDNIIDINVNAQKTPIIIITDEDGEESANAAYLQYDGNVPVMVKLSDFDEDSFKALNTQAPFISRELNGLQSSIMSRYANEIGLATSNQTKAERMNVAEIYASNSGANIYAKNRLHYRQQFCDWLWENAREFCTEGKPEVKITEDALDMLNRQLEINRPYDTAMEEETV